MNNSFFSTNYNRFLATLVLLALVLALGAYAYHSVIESKYMYSGPTTISVYGEGEVMAVPDIGTFSFSVTETGDEAAIAQEASATKVNEIIEALKAAGVEDKDIKTEYYNLYPKYRYEERFCAVGMYCPGEQVPDGFEVTQTIAVKVRNLDDAGSLLSLVGERGATNISSLQFTIDDTDVLKEEARNLAIADAKAKAKTLADELDVHLVKMMGYYEEDQSYPYYGKGGDMMEQSVTASFDTASLPTGENTTTSRVTITYQVR